MSVIDPNVDDFKFEMTDEAPQKAKIKVIGVGGGGSNAVARMMDAGLAGVEFYVLNTDAQALAASPVPNKLSIGQSVTKGRGAGADPGVGREAALEDTGRIVEILEGADMVFITAGLGAGTGTGAAPVIASLARELSILTIAVVTKPFSFEGPRRMKQAEQGLTELAANVDTLITIPNEKLLATAPRGTSLVEGFRMGNDILRQIVQDIVEIIGTPGLINRDFSDIRTTMVGQGYSMMGAGTAKGENAATEAARQAINCPLLEDKGIRGARNVLMIITGSKELGLHDVNEACSLIRDAAANDDVQINFGIVLDESLEDTAKVTVIATGFVEPAAEEQATAAELLAPPPPQIAAPPDPEPKPVMSDPWFQAPVEPPPPAPEFVEPPVEPPAPPPTDTPEPVYTPPSYREPQDLDDLDTPAFLRQRWLRR